MRYIYENENKIIIFINLLMIISLLICFYLLGLFPAVSVLLPYSLVVVVLSCIRYYIPIKIGSMLTSCQLDDYEDYIQYLRTKTNQKSILQNYYLFRIAQYSYYLGDFVGCIQKLKQVKVDTLSQNKYGNIDKLDYYFLAYRTRIELGGEKQIQNIITQLLGLPSSKKKDIYLQKIHLYEDLIVKKQVNNYSDMLPDDSLLCKIEKDYFIAKNNLLKKDFEVAKRYFEKISECDERLFMVREAKEWLNRKEVGYK